MFRYLIVLFIVLPISLLSVTLNFNISNQDIRYNPQINGFDRDSLTDWVFISTPGCYRLPVKTVKVVLPPDAIDISYSYTVNSVTVFSGKAPALSTPFSDGDRVLTSKPSLQPNEYLIYQGIGKWGDVQYARFTIIPALYNSTAESYDIARQIYLSVSYNTASEQTSLSNRIPQLLMQDSSFINRESIINWYRQSNMRTYDYLVVTTPALFNAAQPLVTFRQNQGLVTAFADINQILASTPGANPAEKLRNYLISEYSALPFTYLLLIGDIDVVPIAYLTPEPNGMDTVPSDFYYSDLSSDFDSDNDGKLGEYNTGMDFSPELAVGRIPWNNALTVAQICTRIVIFESSNQPWKQKTLLPSAILNYADEIPNIGWERTDGATFSEYCKATVLSNYQNTTLYEQMGLLPSYPSDYPLQADTLATLINTQSWGIVNWSAHGSSHYSARKVWMYDANNDNIPNGNEMQWFFMVGLDTFDNLVNQDGSVYFCASCYNGMIDDDDASLGEVLIKNKAVADIAATRTGWYKLGWENPGWGGLSSYNYHFLEHYARQGMTVGQAHGFANWLHTQYCLFGDPIDSDGIIWPELQNIYTYLLYGDPAIGYPGNTSSPVAQILIWEPLDNNGNTIVNGLYELGDFNVVYTNHLIDTYNYLNSFDAVFCLFGLGYGQNVYSLPYQGYEYNYLLSYLQQGGKVYMEGMLNWNPDDPLYDRFGTIAPFDHVAYIEQLRYTHNNVNQIWDYNGYNEGTPALATVGVTAQPLFYSYNQYHVNDIIGIWNRIGDSRTISSSFELACVYSDTLSYPQFLRTILDTLGVINNNPVASQDYTNPPAIWNVSASPNPFGRHLNISVKSDKPVTISIYNIKGQLIYSVKELPKNGSIQYLWNGMDESNKYAASGIYLVKVDNGSRSKLIKTLKIR